MPGLLCRCDYRLEAADNAALLGMVRRHFAWEHPAVPINDQTLENIAATHTYGLEDEDTSTE